MNSETGKTKEVPHDVVSEPPIASPHDDLYLYRDSGISERHGVIPLWLTLLCIGLVVWGIYYMIRYWSTS